MNAAERLEAKMSKNSQETKIALVEQSIIHTQETLERLDRKIDGHFNNIDRRLSGMDQRLDKMDGQLDKFNDRLWSNFIWSLSTMFSLATLCCGIMAKGFGWFD